MRENMKNEKKIPIILSSDENYAKQMYVTVISALENKNPQTFYDFYLLTAGKFSPLFQKKFFDLKNKYQNCDIHFVDMSGKFKDLKMQISHITTPTYYRLYAAEVVPPAYSKVIYMDTDVIVLKDLTEYYRTSLARKYIAGVKAAGYIMNKSKMMKYYQSIGLGRISGYINAGVTLWNLDNIRRDNLTPKLLELAAKNFSSMDQDVINVAFQGNIKHLPLKYNLMTKYANMYLDKTSAEYKKLVSIYKEDLLNEAFSDPVIIHYADKVKPWNDKTSFLSQVWWKYAKLTRFKFATKTPPTDPL
jgi:lipopolysaccharide biosynthesis glycosyltransferase